jgi:hypothetical protein
MNTPVTRYFSIVNELSIFIDIIYSGRQYIFTAELQALEGYNNFTFVSRV